MKNIILVIIIVFAAVLVGGMIVSEIENHTNTSTTSSSRKLDFSYSVARQFAYKCMEKFVNEIGAGSVPALDYAVQETVNPISYKAVFRGYGFVPLYLYEDNGTKKQCTPYAELSAANQQLDVYCCLTQWE